MKRRSWILPVLCTILATTALGQAQISDTTNQNGARLFAHHNIKSSLTGSGYLEYARNPESDYRRYYLGWPGINYLATPWLQIWTGLTSIYTVNQNKPDQLELRPYAGTKIFLPNKHKMNLYNFTRYEYRNIEDRGSRDWSSAERIRSRFGAEIPLTSRETAWKPKTFYVIADTELFFRFENAALNPWTLRGGMGYITHDRLRLEFTYSARFDRGVINDGLEYDKNVFRLTVKLGVHRGILGRTSNPGSDQ